MLNRRANKNHMIDTHTCVNKLLFILIKSPQKKKQTAPKKSACYTPSIIYIFSCLPNLWRSTDGYIVFLKSTLRADTLFLSKKWDGEKVFGDFYYFTRNEWPLRSSTTRVFTAVGLFFVNIHRLSFTGCGDASRRGQVWIK